jgi:dolichol-phosphate mannosyltransferase
MGNLPRVSVVLPAYNEEALGAFLIEIERALAPATSTLSFVVVDDCSKGPLPIARSGECLPLGSPVRVLRNSTNLGHGPSAVRAWAQGLIDRPDVVLHVDGDGQFPGEDFPRVLAALDGHDGAIGSRTARRDPWFRRILTLGARVLVGEGLTGSDVNSPLRAYRAPVVQQLLNSLPEHSVVPHLHFAVLHGRLDLDVVEVAVTHRRRLGDSKIGTSWKSGPMASLLPSQRLLSLAMTGMRELRSSRPSVAPPRAPLELVEDAAL